ncbi:uncharacterized protein [Blastocystis hominis]|uniref:Electron transfer flavoprotein subunit beta n=1 Tax=Blastocystis hominis TaxID=12968 RepID=D8M9E0_BLAHO|nr:uncharacterized protein [Blastocystis hominis]CBK24679.2 unnamed protein product [Blastocystis hominis]|eukprot:XP_012898727.1 uncharacterized protein [Blastocystis hominis]
MKNLKMAVNPFCEIAMEQAVRLKEAKVADEIVAVSIGVKAAQEQLRYCMALGADRGILVESSTPVDVDVPPFVVAQALEKIVEKEKPDLVLMGKQSIDGDNKQTGSMLSGLLDWPEATNVSAMKFRDDDPRKVIVEEEEEDGLRTLEVPLPAVITTDLRLNTPRYPKLPDIVKAKKKKKLEVIPLLSLLPDSKSCSILVQYLSYPEQRKSGTIYKTVDELLEQLRNQGILSYISLLLKLLKIVFFHRKGDVMVSK